MPNINQLYINNKSNIQCFRSKSHVNKTANPEKMYKQLFSEKKDLGHVKYKCRIIGRLISIKILWKFFHFNTLIKSKL